MILNTEVKDNTAVVTYGFSEDDMKVLNILKEHGWMEFRGGKGSDIVDRLLDYGFVTTDDDAWHFTVELTELGKSVVKNIK